jgi:16S rRNA (cytosine967-C5)-methyltransferase
MSSADPIRIQASRALLAVRGGQSLDAALVQEVDRDHAQAGLGRALVYAALRHAWSGAALLKRLRTTPGRAPRPPIAAVLDIGLAELRFLATPQHAAVSESVSAARALEPASSGFVNALLRRYLRERDALEAAVLADPEARYDHPQWLVDQIRADWPDDWQGILAAGNRAAPMWLRVDARSGSRADYQARLAALGIDAHAPDAPPYALRLNEATGVDHLPGFAHGLVSVQDAAAQRVVEAIDARPGQRVLDACAAPGGKTAALAERVAGLEIVAIERDPARARRLTDTLARCRVDAQVVIEDACQVARWWDGRPFDRILIDAPCSGTGVIRRHPDIKHHRRPADVQAQVRVQARLLDALRPMLAPGGRLTYATCSIIRAENASQIADFCRRTQDCGPPTQWQNLTGVNDEDGFYFASLQRLA